MIVDCKIIINHLCLRNSRHPKGCFKRHLMTKKCGGNTGYWKHPTNLYVNVGTQITSQTGGKQHARSEHQLFINWKARFWTTSRRVLEFQSPQMATCYVKDDNYIMMYYGSLWFTLGLAQSQRKPTSNGAAML